MIENIYSKPIQFLLSIFLYSSKIIMEESLILEKHSIVNTRSILDRDNKENLKK